MLTNAEREVITAAVDLYRDWTRDAEERLAAAVAEYLDRTGEPQP